MILLVTGGRVATVTKEYVAAVMDTVQEQHGAIDVLIHGGAKGIDSMCGMWALEHGIHVAVVPALWDTYGDAAGPKRNAAMTLLQPDICVAFPGKAGTADMKRKALAAGITLITVG